ncbi:MAG: MFS transporter [Planctomycetota bacterium]|jgi:acyl-[acyl-carrier-protein]-phospholipid O-acyltransferase/long-chain-fatty-acid--[acyl-carrier-protein] ligase|nr:MFS transporter [Planctomycetota bacterium]
MQQAPDESEDSLDSKSLLADRSFWGIAITQFLGAFNDNLYKQLMLLMAIGGIGAMNKDDRQGWAALAFSLPFVLLSGLAGYLSDRNSKSKIIVLCKIAEIAITLLAVLAFWMYGNLGDYGTWSVLILMGVHSTFFGPAKYGILPELFTHKHLPRANGLILMSTFLAIILGVVLAGAIKDLLVVKNEAGQEDFSRLWIGSLACAMVALIGTLTSLLIRKTPAVQPQARFEVSDAIVPTPVRRLLAQDRPLLMALIVSSVFWLVGGLVMPVVNRLGKEQLQLQSDTKTSILTGGLAIGIILGAVGANIVLKNVRKDKQVTLGVLIMMLSMGGLSLWKPNGGLLLGYTGALLGLIVTGIGAAIFVIPLQVFLQERPPAELKGRLIGTMNFANFVGILLAGPIYQILVAIAASMGWPVSSVFAMMLTMLLPILIFYRLPKP